MYMQTMLTGMALKYQKCIAEHRAISKYSMDGNLA